MSLLFMWFTTPNLWGDPFSFPGGFSHETAALTRRCVLFQSRLCPFRSGGNPAVGTPRLLWPPAHGSLPVPRLWQDLYGDERDLFYRLRTERKKILNALAIVTEQGGIRATARVTGIDKDTIQRWVDRARKHVEEVSAYMIVECHLSEAQLDELWTFVKKKTDTSPRRMTRKPSASSTCGVA